MGQVLTKLEDDMVEMFTEPPTSWEQLTAAIKAACHTSDVDAANSIDGRLMNTDQPQAGPREEPV